MPHVLTFLMLLWFSGSAVAADEAPWFEVEIIVFKYTSPDRAAGERWPADPGRPSLQDAVVLRAAKKPALKVGPEPFELLDEKALRLAGTFRSLRRSAAYETLLHVGWLQPGTVKNGSVYISAGSAENKTLEGTVQVSLSRFLHLAVDLLLRTPAPDALPAAQTVEVAAPAASATSFRLTESRRMRSQELHYFDHPRFGVIAQITPYHPPVIEAPVDAPPPAAPQAAGALPGTRPAAPGGVKP